MTVHTYTAISWRTGTSWVVEIPELSRSARVARLSQVEGAARGLVATATAEEPATARVVIDLRGPQTLLELLDAAAAARQDADSVSVEAVTLRRDLARRLADEGFAVRDIAALLGVSYTRAHQLTGDVSHSAVPRAQERRQRPRSGEFASANSVDVTTRGHPHSSYRHEALLYRGEDEFLAGTAPFVREGIALGQPVMVAVPEPRLGRLREALGSVGDDVIFVDMGQLGANPAKIIPGWQAFIDDHGGTDRPVRGIGEPVWAGRRPSELLECQLHEALLNLAVDPDTPLWLRCPYDVDALDAAVVDEAFRSHPALVDAHSYRGSTEYAGAHHVDVMFRTHLPEPHAEAQSSVCVEFDDVGEVRAITAHEAAVVGIEPNRARDLAVAVSEVATNSVRHAGGRGRLRIWREPEAFVVEISDEGQIDDPLVGRRIAPTLDESGRGVWIANQLVDLVQIRSSHRGTTARLVTWL